MPTSIKLITKSVCIGQLVTATAKVARLHRPLKIKSKNPQMQEAKLVDPFKTMKLALWFDFVDSVLKETHTPSQHQSQAKQTNW